jgi:hypothetical protein
MITEHIGDMPYKLQLPEGAKLHNVFHVGVLKKFHGTPPASLGQLPPIKHGCTCIEPEEVSKSRLARGRCQLLVKWKGQDAASSSWVDAEEFLELYPAFELMEKSMRGTTSTPQSRARRLQQQRPKKQEPLRRQNSHTK